jgi:type II secretory pathway pseudopilin PulG
MTLTRRLRGGLSQRERQERKKMIEFLVQHQFWAAVAAYWIFSAAVSAMPEPGPSGSPGYLWLYRFLHTTAGNITTALGSRIPGLKTIPCLLLVAVVLSTTACAAGYRVHPGSLNTTDSAAYDTLLIAKAAIDQARTENQARPLPADVKETLNTVIKVYNVARDAWLTYRGAVSTNTPSDQYLQQLTKHLTDLTGALESLKGREAQAR